jgi:hypothetical protein
MREIRLSGSEGGGNGTTGPPYPYHGSRCLNSRNPWMVGNSPTMTGWGDDASRLQHLVLRQDLSGR